MHAYWARGGTWPGKDAACLGEAVVGPGAKLPPPPAVWAVAGLLATSSACVALAPRQRRIVGVARTGTGITALALLARGAIGLPTSMAAGMECRYHRLDVTVYSPLCLALGTGALLTLRQGSRRAPISAG